MPVAQSAEGLELGVAGRFTDGPCPRLGLERRGELAEPGHGSARRPSGPGRPTIRRPRARDTRAPRARGRFPRRPGQRGALPGPARSAPCPASPCPTLRAASAIARLPRPGWPALDRRGTSSFEQQEVIGGGQRGIVQTVETRLPLEQDAQHLAESPEVDQGRRLAEHQTETSAVAHLRREPLRVGERLFQHAERFHVGRAARRLLGHARETFDGAVCLIGPGISGRLAGRRPQ